MAFGSVDSESLKDLTHLGCTPAGPQVLAQVQDGPDGAALEYMNGASALAKL